MDDYDAKFAGLAFAVRPHVDRWHHVRRLLEKEGHHVRVADTPEFAHHLLDYVPATPRAASDEWADQFVYPDGFGKNAECNPHMSGCDGYGYPV